MFQPCQHIDHDALLSAHCDPALVHQRLCYGYRASRGSRLAKAQCVWPCCNRHGVYAAQTGSAGGFWILHTRLANVRTANMPDLGRLAHWLDLAAERLDGMGRLISAYQFLFPALFPCRLCPATLVWCVALCAFPPFDGAIYGLHADDKSQ